MSSLGPAPTETWTRSLHAASRDAAGPPVPGAAGAERTRACGLSGRQRHGRQQDRDGALAPPRTAARGRAHLCQHPPRDERPRVTPETLSETRRFPHPRCHGTCRPHGGQSRGTAACRGLLGPRTPEPRALFLGAAALR